MAAQQPPHWRTKPYRYTRYRWVSSVAWETVWSRVSVASPTGMSNVSHGPRSSSQGTGCRWPHRDSLMAQAPAVEHGLPEATPTAAWGVCIIDPMTNDLEQLRGEVERLVYSSEESGFTICRIVVPGRGRPGDSRRNHAGNPAGRAVAPARQMDKSSRPWLPVPGRQLQLPVARQRQCRAPLPGLKPGEGHRPGACRKAGGLLRRRHPAGDRRAAGASGRGARGSGPGG